MSVSAIGGVTSLGSLASLAGITPTSAASATDATAAASSSSALFGTSLTGSIDQLQAMQANADGLAVKAVTGDLDDVHDYTIAASQASVSLELTSALRNKAVEAFNEIMRMQA